MPADRFSKRFSTCTVFIKAQCTKTASKFHYPTQKPRRRVWRWRLRSNSAISYGMYICFSQCEYIKYVCPRGRRDAARLSCKRVNITSLFKNDAHSVSLCYRAKMKGFSPWPGRVSLFFYRYNIISQLFLEVILCFAFWRLLPRILITLVFLVL